MRKIWVIAFALLISGCGVKQQTIRLTMPELRVDQPDGRPIVVGAVIDAREAPENSHLSATDLAKNVGGAWRGGNGVRVDLEHGDVPAEVRELVVQSLRAVGYRVLPSRHGRDDVPMVSIKLTKFAVIMPFDFWRAATYSQHMLADISTEISTKRKDGSIRQFQVSGHGENVYQRITPENWEIAINRAMSDYSGQLKRAAVDFEN